MAATITPNTFGRIATVATVTAVKVSVDANSVSYATSLGGLALDLYDALVAASPQSATINGDDVVGVVPLGLSKSGFLPTHFELGTVTSTSIPGYIKLVGIGSAVTNHSALGEIVDGACTETFDALVLIARGGQN